jgi:predicted RNase H-like HicB family nuclease
MQLVWAFVVDKLCGYYFEKVLMKICVVRHVLMAKYTVVYAEEIEGGFSGRCLELPGAISQGETLGELKVNMTDAIQLMLASIYEEAHEKKKMEIEVSE